VKADAFVMASEDGRTVGIGDDAGDGRGVMLAELDRPIPLDAWEAIVQSAMAQVDREGWASIAAREAVRRFGGRVLVPSLGAEQ
jgi:hypothetical protein